MLARGDAANQRGSSPPSQPALDRVVLSLLLHAGNCSLMGPFCLERRDSGTTRPSVPRAQPGGVREYPAYPLDQEPAPQQVREVAGRRSGPVGGSASRPCKYVGAHEGRCLAWEARVLGARGLDRLTLWAGGSRRDGCAVCAPRDPPAARWLLRRRPRAACDRGPRVRGSRGCGPVLRRLGVSPSLRTPLPAPRGDLGSLVGAATVHVSFCLLEPPFGLHERRRFKGPRSPGSSGPSVWALPAVLQDVGEEATGVAIPEVPRRVDGRGDIVGWR